MPPTQLSATHPSPKRKRDHPPFVPHLNTTLRTVSTSPGGSPTPSGADSPRNAVADQLRGMTIAAIPMAPLTPTEDVVRKKPKLEMMRESSATSLEASDRSQRTLRDGRHILDDDAPKLPAGNASREIPETPQRHPHLEQPRIFSDIVACTQPHVFGTSLNANILTQGPASQGNPKVGIRTDASHSYLPDRSPSPSPTPASLTWQDSEITGHLADPTADSEDDGTGLNGIGFRPTPALAYQRAQRRKQQLMDWRAREAREARAKRSERRRRGMGGIGMGSREGTVERETAAKEAEAAVHRAVRFAV